MIIEISEEDIIKRIDKIIAREVNDKIREEVSEVMYARPRFIKDALSDAIKECIYSQKEDIIEKVIERAATEVARKATPRLVQMILEGDERSCGSKFIV